MGVVLREHFNMLYGLHLSKNVLVTDVTNHALGVEGEG